MTKNIPSATVASALPEFTVSQLAGAIQASLEQTFGAVRLRGEISGFKKHTSGHAYFALKDQDAVIDAVCWRGTLSRSSLALSEGMEIVAIGRVTSYPQRSRYQIIIEAFELTGEGSLLKVLEDLKQRLKREGLFEGARKKPLPSFPQRVGIITSPTGAVIQDMLHRLQDRVPCHVLLWPVAVQGQGSVEQIIEALEGFNAYPPARKPDVIIVARGGGSLEDLWGFNDERMVRAVAASSIPVVSAIGHETDTTLVDYASDHRAPTPTAAAEIILPLKTAVQNMMLEMSHRMSRRVYQMFEVRHLKIQRLYSLLSTRRQMLDVPRQRLDEAWERATLAILRRFQRDAQQLEQSKALLESYAYHRTLERGFCFVDDAQGVPIISAHSVSAMVQGSIHFHDGAVPVLLKPQIKPPKPIHKTQTSQKSQTQLW